VIDILRSLRTHRVGGVVAKSLFTVASPSAAVLGKSPAADWTTATHAAGAPSGTSTAGALRAVAPARAGEGDPDPAVFGVDGKVGVHGSATSDDMLIGTSLYPDGRIIASGFMTDSGESSGIVTRRNPNGSPDPTFGGGTGIVSVPGIVNGSAQKTIATADEGMVGAGYTNVDGQGTPGRRGCADALVPQRHHAGGQA
jgi:hypothetical protein